MNYGDLGLRCSESIAVAAFLASCCSPLKALLNRFICGNDSLTSIPGEQFAHSCFQSLLPGWSIPDSPSQHNLQEALDCHQFRALFNGSSIRDRAHLNSLHSSKFTPNPNLGLSLVVPEFICALRYWLGIPFFDTSHLCSCNSTLDSHLLGCDHGPLHVCRHDALCHIVFQAPLQDNSQVRQEQCLFGSFATHPGDTFHPDFADGCPTYCS